MEVDCGVACYRKIVTARRDGQSVHMLNGWLVIVDYIISYDMCC